LAPISRLELGEVAEVPKRMPTIGTSRRRSASAATQERPVAAEHDDEVGLVGRAQRGPERRDEDADVALLEPALSRRARRHARGARVATQNRGKRLHAGAQDGVAIPDAVSPSSESSSARLPCSMNRSGTPSVSTRARGVGAADGPPLAGGVLEHRDPKPPASAAPRS
jgi:hypothetical protein